MGSSVPAVAATDCGIGRCRGKDDADAVFMSARRVLLAALRWIPLQLSLVDSMFRRPSSGVLYYTPPKALLLLLQSPTFLFLSPTPQKLQLARCARCCSLNFATAAVSFLFQPKDEADGAHRLSSAKR